MNHELIAAPAIRRGIHLAIYSSPTMTLLTFYPNEISRDRAVASLTGFCGEVGKRPAFHQELSLINVTNVAVQEVAGQSMTVECRKAGSTITD